MSIVRLRFILVLPATLALCACSRDDSKKLDQAVAVDGGVFDGGRDPFGSEKAAALATDDERPDAGGVGDPTKCTNFNLTIVGPFVQVVGEEAVFWGHAADDQRHDFKLYWSAAPGKVSDERGESTKHICTEPGLSTISMTASLAAVCSSAIAHVVTCLEPIK
jgi:hypothetical protein